MIMILFRKAFLLILVVGIFSCSDSKVSYHYPKDADKTRKSNVGKFSSKTWVIGDKKRPNLKEENAELAWQSTIEVISEMFPISIIDNKSGIIATDWIQKGNSNLGRIKINVLIKASENINNSVRVSVFEQNRSSRNEDWGSKPNHNIKSVADSTMKSEQIKEKILNKVREIKNSNEKRNK